MNITVNQTIAIHMLKVGSITNSSVLQIGTTGSIQAHTELQNTGGFTETAQEAEAIGAEVPPVITLTQPLR
ncbi:spore germination protein GerPB [Ornithinibacillus halophilus]|uniref:Spore germination protein PB n=1 Tax=Ornithinibacillus halophilus TaxID=930117 RepID=A0A1M5I2K0_9BACI|nr:spore germination protein GerPB [Ornithinibacillus halophilus]SHG22213.1 spore germination protein PB [Ornithinibacillus halophilus]